MKFAVSAALLATAILAVEAENWNTQPQYYEPKAPECPDPDDYDHLDTSKYQELSAYCKQQIIWEKVVYEKAPERFFVGKELNGVFTSDMNQIYDTVSDTMPLGRIKRVMTRGCISKAEFIPTYDSPYTGVFQGCKNGLVRISEFTSTTPEVPKTSPNAEFKCLRDGMSSANLITAFAFDGQPSFNYFKNRYTNILREPQNECTRATYAKCLADCTNHIGAMSVMEMAQYDDRGRAVKQPNWPFMIDLEPYDVYGWTDAYQNDFNDQLTVIKADTSLFKVFAYDQPPELGGQDHQIGWIVTRSDMITSRWAD